MKTLEQLAAHYLNTAVGKIEIDEIDILRKDLMLVTPNEISSIEDATRFLEILAMFRSAIDKVSQNYGENFKKTLRSMLSVGADGVYTNGHRFIYELIQNVDDCDYSDPSNCELDIKFDSVSGKIILKYNELGFTPSNVFAITGIAEAAKNISSDKVEIGEKGIGFKSVFGVADKVSIKSGWFSFEIEKENFTIPIPKYEDFSEKVEGTELTLFLDKLRVESIYKQFAEQYCKNNAILNKNPLIFLNKLTKLRFYFDSFRNLEFTTTRNSIPQNNEIFVEENVVLSATLKDYANCTDILYTPNIRCKRYTFPVVYDKETFESRYGTREDYIPKTYSFQVIVPDLEYLTGKDKISEGLFYSFLPTEIKTSVPIICHAPFKLDSSREHVDSENNNKWFKFSCQKFSELLSYVFKDLAVTYKEKIVYYLPSKDNYIFIENANDDACLKISSFKGERFLKENVFYTLDGTFVSAEDCFSFDESEKLNDHQLTAKLLSVKKKEFLPPQGIKVVRFGIETVKNAKDKLLDLAVKNETYTHQALGLLDDFDEASCEKLLEKCAGVVLSINQVSEFFGVEKIRKYFANDSKKAISKFSLPAVSVKIRESDCFNIKNILSETEPLEDSDFPKQEGSYLSKIGFTAYLLDSFAESIFFPAKNVLILSGKDKVKSLSKFCQSENGSDVLASRLVMQRVSEKLNEADENLSDEEYLSMLSAERKIIKDTLGNKTYSRFIDLINNSGSSPDRFINELLQNADDCIYPDNCTPTFILEYNEPDIIRTRYNEIGFTKKNVRAITAIGESTKKRMGSGFSEIGEKGVGFKSVFAVAEEVSIFSGDFCFGLSSKAPTVPQIKKKPEKYNGIGTAMRFKLKNPIKDTLFTEENILSVCRCLRKLKRIVINGITVIITDTDSSRTISINGKEYVYKKFVHGFEVEDDQAIKEREAGNKTIDRNQNIVCLIPENTKESKEVYKLYSGLPTTVNINIPLIIDAPFELTTSRDSVLECRWNEIVRSEVYSAILEIINIDKKINGIKALRFLSFSYDNVKSSYFISIFSAEYLNDYRFLDDIRNQLILKTVIPEKYIYAKSGITKRYPDVVLYLMKNGTIKESNGVIDTYLIKKEDVLRALNALGCKEKSCDDVVSVLSRYIATNIRDEDFRKLFFTYLKSHSQELSDHSKGKLRSLPIIPVKGRIAGTTEYVCWEENKIYEKPEATVSPDKYSILAAGLLSKQDFEQVLDVSINKMDSRYEKSLYQDELGRIIDASSDVSKLYKYLLSEFESNPLFKLCKDTLIARKDKIPLKNELGVIRRGNIFVNRELQDYFFGSLARSLSAHEECTELAAFIQCKDLSQVHYDDIIINSDLSEDDLNDFTFGNFFRYANEIIQNCINDGFISDELIEKFRLGGLVATEFDSSDYDFPTEKVKSLSALEKHLSTAVLSNPIEIVHREVLRTVQYGKLRSGDEFLLENDESRKTIMSRYMPYGEPDKCFCQMCLSLKNKNYIEVNNILLNPKYYWRDLRVALCLECSKKFKELRNNEVFLEDFKGELADASVYGDEAIEIPFGPSETVTFTQKHLAEIQIILEYNEELND